VTLMAEPVNVRAAQLGIVDYRTLPLSLLRAMKWDGDIQAIREIQRRCLERLKAGSDINGTESKV
jgi:hypothetical protein